MDKITLAHIGGEIVLIGGVAFYFHRKTVKMNEQIVALQKENAELKEAIQELNNSLQELGMIVMQMRGAQRASVHQPTPQQQSPIAPIIMSMMSPPMQQNKVTEKAIKKPALPKKQSQQQQQTETFRAMPPRKTDGGDDSGDETLDEADLDKEIEKELVELSKERTVPKMECDDDVCKLVDDE